MDSDASEKSVKLAYRRLARENHPDLLQNRGKEVLEQAAETMRLINEAYRVLSNKQLRHQYDRSMTEGTTFSIVVAPPASAVATPTAAAAPAAAKSARWRPDSEVLSSIVDGFTRQFQNDLSAVGSEFKWENTKIEGFDWAVCAGFWTSRYVIALRGFAMANVESANKFTNYCNLALSRYRHPLKQTHFLFFLAFHKSSDQQTVAAILRRFCANDQGQRTSGPACIVLTDVGRGKSLLCGARPDDSRYGRLLSSLGLIRGN